MKGYLKNPKATAEAFAGGWFHTGDLAVLQPDGYVKIKDRSKDIIISGGENISSLEVEDALYRHPGGARLRGGRAARSEVGRDAAARSSSCKPGATVSAAELIAHCRAHLAGFKVPREIRFEPIPKTSTGKIQKFLLRERARSARGDRVGDGADERRASPTTSSPRSSRARDARGVVTLTLEPAAVVQRAERGHARRAAGRARRRRRRRRRRASS